MTRPTRKARETALDIVKALADTPHAGRVKAGHLSWTQRYIKLETCMCLRCRAIRFLKLRGRK
jgi:hypothetical protein